MVKEFTTRELEDFNGKNGASAFIAYDGRIFDVSKSFLWKKGIHQAIHNAGQDLTRYFLQAPHGPEFLLRFPVIGTLKKD